MNNDMICQYCSKEFSNKATLLRHQTTVKSCLELQGKNDTHIECSNCKKQLAITSYKQHKIKCDINIQEKEEKTRYASLQTTYKSLEKQNKKLKLDMAEYKSLLDKSKEETSGYKSLLDKSNAETVHYKSLFEALKIELAEVKSCNILLEKQNEKLHSSSTSVTMRLVEKASTVNHTNHTNNNTVVIQTNQLTNDVLRQCASTFTMMNAYNIKGITKHLTSSLEEHITCTDPSRNIFKYTNEKDEEIVDQNLEILIPQYLTAVKDRNDFLYKEVFEYFKTNNVALSVQTDYRVFYNALNSIIEKTGQQSKYTEKCKQQMVRECKRQFLEKNKNKEKMITKALTVEEVMMNVIETGGSVHDFVDRFFPEYDVDDEETDDEFRYRREMEDLFRVKKREWRAMNV